MAAEQDIGALFQDLAGQLAGLSTTVGAQGISQIITPFEGDPRKFKEWVKSIEKYAVLTNMNQDKVKLVAYQASKGVVSDFIHRYLNENPRDTWATL